MTDDCMMSVLVCFDCYCCCHHRVRYWRCCRRCCCRRRMHHNGHHDDKHDPGDGVAAHGAVEDSEAHGSGMANLRTKIVDFRGFDSSRILKLRGGIIMSLGNFPERLSQAILVGIILVGRLGVAAEGAVWRCHPLLRTSIRAT